MSPAQLARLQAARRLPNSATVAIVLDEYAALIPTLRAADSVPALQGEIAHLKSALAAQVAATEAERVAAAKAKAHADEVRKSLQAGKATAESRALRAEAALEQALKDLAKALTELERIKASQIADAAARLAVAERKIADQAAHLRRLLEIRKLRGKGAACERDNCESEQYSRGLCIRHYQQERRALASGICPSCGLIRAVGRSGRCRSCYLSAVTTLGREAARCTHV